MCTYYKIKYKASSFVYKYIHMCMKQLCYHKICMYVIS